MNETKIINDPVFGFIKIPSGLLLDIVKHPLMQRLSRIKQLGMASVVYPGAQHTRFLHSLGAYHLMSEAITSLRQKGIFIFESEAEAVQAAILMHDIGHGPFSHVLERTLTSGISHEEISLMMMEQMNREMDGRLTLALKIFKDEYHQRFLHQLISSQLDMDRIDYLCRDSFFTGVNEGNIGSSRIIKMMNVVDDHLVVEEKGIYSVENYLVARRLMYWQVYLHKTTVACEKLLVNTLLRAKHLANEGAELYAPPALHYFIYNHVNRQTFLSDPKALYWYEQLDDNDIWTTVKVWKDHPDRILSMLAGDLLSRQLFRVEISEEPFTEEYVESIKAEIMKHTGVSREDTKFLMHMDSIKKAMYDVHDDHIDILYKDGTLKEVIDASEILHMTHPAKDISKYYLCYKRF